MRSQTATLTRLATRAAIALAILTGAVHASSPS